MKEAFYFPHDCNAIQDPKMMVLFHDCGLMGVGMFWIIIEILHQQEDGQITEDEFKKYLNFYYKMDDAYEDNLIRKIEETLFSTGLLTKKDGFVSSARVMRNKQHRELLSNAGRIGGKASANKRLATTVQRTIDNDEKTVEANKGKERKGKKINTIAHDKKPLVETQRVAFESVWSIYPRRLDKKRAFRAYCATVTSKDEHLRCYRAVENYLAEIEDKGTEEKYIKHGSTFFNNWQDYYDLNPIEGPVSGTVPAEATAVS